MSDATTTMTKEHAVQTQADAFELLLRPEYQDALRDIVEQLPKLATIASIFGKLYDVSSEALSDGELMGALEQMVVTKTKPVTETYENVTEAVKEAKLRAESDTSTIGVFGVLRLLKDPSVQRSLKMVSAFLQVWGEKSKTSPNQA